MRILFIGDIIGRPGREVVSAELPGERREDLSIRIDELRKLQAGVERQARLALRGEDSGEHVQDTSPAQDAAGATSPGTAATGLDEATVRHALERLEAILRARTATGFRLKR